MNELSNAIQQAALEARGKIEDFKAAIHKFGNSAGWSRKQVDELLEKANIGELIFDIGRMSEEALSDSMKLIFRALYPNCKGDAKVE
jgi:hypothetical protein